MFSLDLFETDEFSWSKALSLAHASKLAYSSPDVVVDSVTNVWGFDRCHFFDEHSTQGFVALGDSAILIAFRGSESVGDWLSNLRVTSEPTSYGHVHGGFLAAYAVVRDQIREILADASTSPGRIWITGHSLGGALAAMALADLDEGGNSNIAYTFGQPRLGKGETQAHFSHLISNGFQYHRFVNNRDIVTRVPPGFDHVGSTIRFDGNGTPSSETMTSDPMVAGDEPPPLSEEEFRQIQDDIHSVTSSLSSMDAEAFGHLLDPSIEGLIPGYSDHYLDRYISVLHRLANDAPQNQSVSIALEGFFSRSSSIYKRAGEEFAANPHADQKAELVPAVLELRDQAWQPPADLKVNSRLGSFVSVQATRDQLEALGDDKRVSSIEASRSGGIGDLHEALDFVKGDVVRRPPFSERGDKAVVGIIDDGIDVLHECFRDQAGKSRILAVWDQHNSDGPSPAEVDPDAFQQGYGTLFTAQDIAEFIDGIEDPPLRLRDYLQKGHGTHVASIAAGRAVGDMGDGIAPDAQVIAVLPKMETDPDAPYSLGYSNSHFDALVFMKRAAQGDCRVLQEELPLAINVSQGMNAGAHDGQTKLERMFDAVTSMGTDRGIVIVKSAGNEGEHHGHARRRPINGVFEFTWQSSDIKRTHDYFELWSSDQDRMSFRLIDPTGHASEMVPYEDAEGKMQYRTESNANGNRSVLELTPSHPDCIDSLLAITITSSEVGTPIQTGTWRLQVQGHEIRSAEEFVDIWVERQGNRAVRLDNSERHVTLSIPGTAASVITVGACDKSAPLSLAPFSSLGRTRRDRANRLSKPELCAPGVEILAAKAHPQDFSATTTMSGTSMAAPHVTGALALAMSARYKKPGSAQFTAQQLRSALQRTVQFRVAVHDEGVGLGMLSIEALMADLARLP